MDGVACRAYSPLSCMLWRDEHCKRRMRFNCLLMCCTVQGCEEDLRSNTLPDISFRSYDIKICNDVSSVLLVVLHYIKIINWKRIIQRTLMLYSQSSCSE